MLDSDTLLLEYALGEDRSYLWAVTNSSIDSFELPKRAEVEAAARRAYDLLTARNRCLEGETTQQRSMRLVQAEAEYFGAAEALSRMVLSPAASLLTAKRLLIVCEGALQYIPFAALPMPVAGDSQSQSPASYLPLIVDHEIVSLPSASALAVLRREIAGRKPAEKAVAVLADPVFDNGDDRLLRTIRLRKTTQKSAMLGGSRQWPTDVERALRDVGLGNGGQISRLPFTRREAEAIRAVARFPGASPTGLLTASPISSSIT